MGEVWPHRSEGARKKKGEKFFIKPRKKIRGESRALAE